MKWREWRVVCVGTAGVPADYAVDEKIERDEMADTDSSGEEGVKTSS
jgi:hypothetical protein